MAPKGVKTKQYALYYINTINESIFILKSIKSRGKNKMPWNRNPEQLKEKLLHLHVPNPHITKLFYDLEYIKNSVCFNDITYIILFGSCSKGTAVLPSDIDLCILTSRALSHAEIADIRMTLNDDTNFHVETNVVILTEKVFRTYFAQYRLYQEIGDGLQLYHKEAVTV